LNSRLRALKFSQLLSHVAEILRIRNSSCPNSRHFRRSNPDLQWSSCKESFAEHFRAATTNHGKYQMNTDERRELLSVAEFARRHPSLSQSSLRWLIYRSKPRLGPNGPEAGNGFDRVVRRIGRRVFLDEAEFWQWLDLNNSISH